MATEPAAHRAAKQPLLRLSDLPAGYRIGDDSGCGNLSTDGRAPRLSHLSGAELAVMCSRQFERLYAKDEKPRSAPLVESLAAVFRSVGGAQQALGLAEDILHHFTSLSGGKRAREVRSASRLGDATRAFRSTDALVGGRPAPGSAVVWRSGRVLGLVVVGGSGGRAGDRGARSLARIQQRRIERPMLQQDPTEQDDREVALDNPLLGIDVHWLGRRLDPSGRLPVLTLDEAIGPLPPGGGPGNTVMIRYTTAPRLAGVTLDLWKPAAWERFTKTRLGRLVWDSPCAQATRLPVLGGRAVIYSGYSTQQRQPCPQRRFDRYLAHVYLDDVVVAINVPNCFACAPPAAPKNADPYNSIAGMEAIARGLRARPAPK